MGAAPTLRTCLQHVSWRRGGPARGLGLVQGGGGAAHFPELILSRVLWPQTCAPSGTSTPGSRALGPSLPFGSRPWAGHSVLTSLSDLQSQPSGGAPSASTTRCTVLTSSQPSPPWPCPTSSTPATGSQQMWWPSSCARWAKDAGWERKLDKGREPWVAGEPVPGTLPHFTWPRLIRSRTGDREREATADRIRRAVHLQPGLSPREVAAQTYPSQDPGTCTALPGLPRIPAPQHLPGSRSAHCGPGPTSSCIGSAQLLPQSCHLPAAAAGSCLLFPARMSLLTTGRATRWCAKAVPRC